MYCIPQERRNGFAIPLFKIGDRRDPKNYRGISIFNICYQIHSKTLNIELESYSEQFMTETQNGFQRDVHSQIQHFASN
jgi:hypothetical protein